MDKVAVQKDMPKEQLRGDDEDNLSEEGIKETNAELMLVKKRWES